MMARIRSIHPGLWTDEAFMSLSANARLLLIGLWTEAHDDGVFEWKPLTLKARIFPVDNVDVETLLAELIAVDVIKRATGFPKEPGMIRNFRKYQRPQKPNESGLLPDEYRTYVGLKADSTLPVRDQYDTGTRKSPQMEDVGGRRKEKEVDSVADATEADASLRPAPESIPEKPKPVDWDKALFDAAVSALEGRTWPNSDERKVSPADARSLAGKLKKSRGGNSWEAWSAMQGALTAADRVQFVLGAIAHPPPNATPAKRDWNAVERGIDARNQRKESVA
jgi:hypothetical protein